MSIWKALGLMFLLLGVVSLVLSWFLGIGFEFFLLWSAAAVFFATGALELLIDLAFKVKKLESLCESLEKIANAQEDEE